MHRRDSKTQPPKGKKLAADLATGPSADKKQAADLRQDICLPAGWPAEY
jgi:hypothetical protein